MTIQEYISSGLLESYVLGLTSEEETREIESLALQHEAIRDEIVAIQGAMEKYAMQFAQEPSSGLKSKVMASLDALAGDNPATQPFIAVERTTDDEPMDTSAVPDVSFPVQTRQRFWLAAASIVLGFSLLGNLFFYRKWKDTEGQLAYAQAQQQQLALQTQALQTRMNTVMTTASVVTNPEYKVVHLAPMEKGMDATAVIYWHPAKGNLYVSSHKLPPLPPGKAYRLWLIGGNGPIWAGDMPADSSQEPTLVTMRQLAMPAAAFAITAEDVTESTAAPAGKMYVKGNV